MAPWLGCISCSIHTFHAWLCSRGFVLHVRHRQRAPITQRCQLLCAVLRAAANEKGSRKRRENTSSRFQAFCTALGHENWNLCCLNDEMAHQRDLKLSSTQLVTERSSTSREPQGMMATSEFEQFLFLCFISNFPCWLIKPPLGVSG